MVETIETIERIKARHPVREAFSGRSTGNDRGCYYSTKGHAVSAFNAELRPFRLRLDRDDLADFHDNEGRKTIEVHNEFGHRVCWAVISWYRTETGRYEFVGYLA